LQSGYDDFEAGIAAYYYDKTKRYINNIHYDAYTYLDEKKKRMRSVDSIKRIESEIKKICNKYAHDLVVELKRKNILEVSELEKKVQILSQICDDYYIKIEKDTDNYMSGI